MKLNLWPFAIIFFTDRLVPERFGAFAVWPFIFIRPKYRNDRGLLEHELQHVRQIFRYGVLPFPFLYLLNAEFKLRMEAEAYRVQLIYAPADANLDALRDLFAGFLSAKYGLGISRAEARALLAAPA